MPDGPQPRASPHASALPPARDGAARRRAAALCGVALALAAAAGCAGPGGGVPARVQQGGLVDAAGAPLYTYDRDLAGSGRSQCTGACAKAWPPLAAGPGARSSGDWSVITRDDASRQWAYRGRPLYRHAAAAQELPAGWRAARP